MTVEQEIEELQQRLAQLRDEKRHKDSRAFIAANGITRQDVELMSGDDNPYFGHIADFVEWLNCHSTKRWAEWNTRIYLQSDLKAGHMPHNMPGFIDDLPA